MAERLKRLDFVYQHFPLYFVTACTANRQRLLGTKPIHSAFKQFAASGPNYGAWVGAYVLIPDHLHLFIAIDDQKLSLSRWVKSLKATLLSVLRTEGNSPPYWQKGFFDHVLRSNESVLRKVVLCAGESCARRAGKTLARMAIRWRDLRTLFSRCTTVAAVSDRRCLARLIGRRSRAPLQCET